MVGWVNRHKEAQSATTSEKQTLIFWNEGVAKHTERALEALAADTALYRSNREFAEVFAGSRYTETWDANYANELNPVRFVGEGVKGRVMFYYLGMGKGYVLGRLLPNWKVHYFERDLDRLLAE